MCNFFCKKIIKEHFYLIPPTGKRNVLYIGVTHDLKRRVAEHKAHINSGFTDKYNVEFLVWYKEFRLYKEAILYEKKLKNWKREWKNNLIESLNPEWKDLSEGWIDKDFI